MSRYWKDDEELFCLARQKLFTAVVGDIMDKLRLFHQFLPPQVRPLKPGMIAIGRAMTVLEADFFEESVSGSRNPIAAQPFGLMFEALDDLKPHEIYICTGASPRYALWGEMMTTRAIRCGAAAAVVDGYSRDTRALLALGFPVFSRGSYAQDQSARGKVVDFRIPIEVEGTRVEPGDMVFGDIDGVCVVPRLAEEEVFVGAFEKARREKVTRKALEEGMSASSAFSTFGIM